MNIINHQFKMIGEKITYDELPETGEIVVGKKKMNWWDYYMFKDEEEYLKWKNWAIALLKVKGMENKFDIIDMTYGLKYRLPQTQKEGQMALF